MGMLLISKQLLESEQIEGNGNKLYQSCIAKELEVLKKLDIVFCDMIGTPEDVAKRLEGCEVFIMPKGTYNDLQKAATFRQTVRNLLQEDADEQSGAQETGES